MAKFKGSVNLSWVGVASLSTLHTWSDDCCWCSSPLWVPKGKLSPEVLLSLFLLFRLVWIELCWTQDFLFICKLHCRGTQKCFSKNRNKLYSSYKYFGVSTKHTNQSMCIKKNMTEPTEHSLVKSRLVNHMCVICHWIQIKTKNHLSIFSRSPVGALAAPSPSGVLLPSVWSAGPKQASEAGPAPAGDLPVQWPPSGKCPLLFSFIPTSSSSSKHFLCTWFQVTKIFQKKKNSVTYSFRQSFSLYGMQVMLFESQCKWRFALVLTTPTVLVSHSTAHSLNNAFSSRGGGGRWAVTQSDRSVSCALTLLLINGNCPNVPPTSPSSLTVCPRLPEWNPANIRDTRCRH